MCRNCGAIKYKAQDFAKIRLNKMVKTTGVIKIALTRHSLSHVRKFEEKLFQTEKQND
jgi:hypothetical protein